MPDFVCTLIFLYVIAIFARIVLDWFQVPSDHPVGQVRRFLSMIVDPLLRPLRQVLPSIPAGQMRIDLSPIVLIIAVQIVGSILCR